MTVRLGLCFSRTRCARDRDGGGATSPSGSGGGVPDRAQGPFLSACCPVLPHP